MYKQSLEHGPGLKNTPLKVSALMTRLRRLLSFVPSLAQWTLHSFLQSEIGMWRASHPSNYTAWWSEDYQEVRDMDLESLETEDGIEPGSILFTISLKLILTWK